MLPPVQYVMRSQTKRCCPHTAGARAGALGVVLFIYLCSRAHSPVTGQIMCFSLKQRGAAPSAFGGCQSCGHSVAEPLPRLVSHPCHGSAFLAGSDSLQSTPSSPPLAAHASNVQLISSRYVGRQASYLSSHVCNTENLQY